METGIECLSNSKSYMIRRITLTGLFCLVLVSLLSLSALAGETGQPRNTYLQDKLETARGFQITDGYTNPDFLLAQADEEVYESSSTVTNPYISGAGAGGYYGSKDWQAFTALYLWFVGMNGKTGKGNRIANVDVGFGDIWDNLDFGIQAHIEVWYKKIIFFVDPIYMSLSSSNSNTRVVSTVRSKIDIDMFLLDIAAGYRVAEIPLGSGGTRSDNLRTWPTLSVDIYGGGRILSIDNTLRLKIDTPVGQIGEKKNISESWFDFIIGTRLLFDVTENLLFTIKTDVGGFGLGFSSDIDWNFVANVGYQLPWWGITPYVGYRVLYIDYKDGSGDNRFVYDIWNTGPQVGVGVNF